MNIKLITSGSNITVYTNNGDKQGLTPVNNEILIENVGDCVIEVDPNSTDKVVAVVTIIN